MSTLLIIDGNAIVHRAYHAYPQLTDSEGNLINAVYGFFAMLLKVIDEVKPTYLAVCFDRPAPTFRKLLYAGYQADRPTMADNLSSQIEVLHIALEKAKIAIYELDGYEADDLIGTLATQAVQISVLGSLLSDKSQPVVSLPVSDKRNVEVVILSGDRDLLQLVNDNVKVMMPVTGITKMIVHDEKSVEEKYGIKPRQFIDYKALVGDASDGYPGVTGIGPKTAATLLQKFGTFENLYRHVGSLPEKVSLKLATDAEQAALAKKLATIIIDAPVHLDLEKCSLSNVTKDDFYNAWGELGFPSLRKRLEGMSMVKQRKEQLELL